jgi:intergrase/recombinase
MRTRERKGEIIETWKNDKIGKKTYRFCDVASTHTMRRTAITTMLSLGMPEQIVRRISGHAPEVKNFIGMFFGTNLHRPGNRKGI